MEQNEFKTIINYETAMTKFFRELGLKANQRLLIMAFIIVSNGEKFFEASFPELGDVLAKKTEDSPRPDTNAKNALKGLLKWQDEHEIELIRVISPGKIIKDKEGEKTFVKSKYEFVALNELIKAFYSNESDLDLVIEQSLSEIRAKFKPSEKKRKYHPLHNYKKAKNSIFTLIKNVFNYTKEAGLNPVNTCEDVLNKSQNIVNELKNDWDEEQNLDKYINQFESILKKKEEEFEGENYSKTTV